MSCSENTNALAGDPLAMPLLETDTSELDLAEARRRLVELFDRDAYAALPGGSQMRQLLATGIPTRVITDLLYRRV